MEARDVMTPSQRHKAMSHNRGRTGPERALASALWREGFRYLTDSGYRRLTGKSLPGHPDIIFSGRSVVLFLDGCFWHGCLECGKVKEDIGLFWLQKIRTNRERDKRTNRQLLDLGWRVLRVPEHAVRRRDRLEQTVRSLIETLTTTGAQIEGGLL